MLVKIKYLANLFGYGYTKVGTIIDRAEFAKYRYGGTGGIFFDLNDESFKLLKNFLIRKPGREK